MSWVCPPYSAPGSASPQKIGANAIPFIIAPTGSMANNGVITLGTALDQIYANAYVFLAAGAIAAGSLAGWYFAQFSSTTVGVVFNNTYASGVPTIPTVLPFVTTGPGAYTGVTSAVVGPQITLPGGAMGPNGVLQLSTLWSALNNANAKTLTITVGGTNILNGSLASVAAAQVLSTIYNRGNAAINASMPTANIFGFGSANANPLQSAINTAVAQTIAMGGTLSVATDFLILAGYLAEVSLG